MEIIPISYEITSVAFFTRITGRHSLSPSVISRGKLQRYTRTRIETDTVTIVYDIQSYIAAFIL